MLARQQPAVLCEAYGLGAIARAQLGKLHGPEPLRRFPEALSDAVLADERVQAPDVGAAVAQGLQHPHQHGHRLDAELRIAALQHLVEECRIHPLEEPDVEQEFALLGAEPGEEPGQGVDQPRAARVGGALGAREAPRIFREMAGKAGLPPGVVSAISGHSARVGAAQAMVAEGISIASIMQAGRWRTEASVIRYAERTVDAREAAALEALLRGSG